MKIDEQWEWWTLCAIKMKARSGGKGRHLWPRLVQKMTEGKPPTSWAGKWKWWLKIKKVVGNTPYGRDHTSRTIYVTPLQSILDESLHSRQSFWNYWQINSTPSWRTPHRRTLQITLRQLENRASSRHRCLTLNFVVNANHSHADRCQPLTDRQVRATQR